MSEPATLPIRDIAQILILDGGAVPALLPAQVRRNIASLKEHHPSARHRLLGGLDVRTFIAAHFDADVLKAYDTLKPYAYRADLARACVLLHFGGMYSDISNFFMRPWRIPAPRPLAAFRDLGLASGAPWTVANGLLHAEPGQPELRAMIDLIVAHCRERFYGANPLCPTGPVAWGEVLAHSAGLMTRAYIGETRALTPEFDNHTPCFIDPEGRLIALRMKESSGDLASLGLTGGNNYNEIWHQRLVYGETRWDFAHNHPQIRVAHAQRRADGTDLATQDHACVVFGPYISLPAASWTARFKFAHGTLQGNASVDVVHREGQHCLAAFADHEVTHPDPHTVAVRFELTKSVQDLEVRLFGEHFSGRFQALELERNDA